MRERPILFSAPMVRAILAGTKTQTRRAMKPQPSNGWTVDFDFGLGRITSPHPRKDRFGIFITRGKGTRFPETDLIPCPYGQPGDRLWVRETFGIDISERGCVGIRYIADNAMRTLIYEEGSELPVEIGNALVAKKREHRWKPPCKPSIFMRRVYSRITLEIVNVRVERLNDISEEDARAEGIEEVPDNSPFCGKPGWRDYSGDGILPFDYDKPQASYRTLWESINGPGSWAANPWVWVIEFKRIGGAK